MELGQLQEVNLHEAYCKSILTVERDFFLILPSKTGIKVNKAGMMGITATNELGQAWHFEDTLVFLVEDASWTELLIGRPTLKEKGPLPTQIFCDKDQTST